MQRETKIEREKIERERVGEREGEREGGGGRAPPCYSKNTERPKRTIMEQHANDEILNAAVELQSIALKGNKLKRT